MCKSYGLGWGVLKDLRREGDDRRRQVWAVVGVKVEVKRRENREVREKV